MIPFTKSSLKNLATCDLRLIDAVNLAQQSFYKETGYGIQVVCGHRTKKEQAKLFARGFSKVPPGKSKHNFKPAKAVDLAPLSADGKIPWNDSELFHKLAEAMMRASRSGLRWGGDWDGDGQTSDESFKDLGHFELMSHT